MESLIAKFENMLEVITSDVVFPFPSIFTRDECSTCIIDTARFKAHVTHVRIVIIETFDRCNVTTKENHWKKINC